MSFFKKFYFLIFLISSGAYAVENINKSLISAYLTNPKLNAERERTKAVDENLVQAFSAFKPTVTISAYKSDTDSSKITKHKRGYEVIDDLVLYWVPEETHELNKDISLLLVSNHTFIPTRTELVKDLYSLTSGFLSMTFVPFPELQF